MNRIGRKRKFDLMLEQQRAAIGVPQAEIRMHQNAERRRFQPLGASRPLLEGQPRLFEWVNGARTETSRNRIEDMPRPAIERIWGWFALLREPRRKIRPDAPAAMTDQYNAVRRLAGRSWRRGLVLREDETAANYHPVLCQRSGKTGHSRLPPTLRQTSL